MAKYLTEFNTYADYSGATLSLPNVSLIKNTGEVYYKNIYAGATVGDVLMYDVANQKLVATLNAQWDATTYPIASYEPIAICAIPVQNSTDNKSHWISTLEPTTAGTGNTYSSPKWENKITVDHNAKSSGDGRSNTDIIIEQADFSATEYPAFYAVNVYHTSGTTAGDWYLPAIDELIATYSGLTAINGNLTAIKTASSSKAEPIAAASYWSSTERNASTAWTFIFSDGRTSNSQKVNGVRLRAMLSL